MDDPATLSMSRFVPPGKTDVYEAWVKDISISATNFSDAYLGTTILRPQGPDHVSVWLSTRSAMQAADRPR